MTFDFSKNDESINFENGMVTKYFKDSKIVENRCERAEYLEGLCPKIESRGMNFYSYKFVEGEVLYDVINSKTTRELLNWSMKILWKKQDLNETELKEFYLACKLFYKDKTEKRLKLFYSKNNLLDEENDINGITIPTLKELFDKIDFNYLYKGIPVRFHGDYTIANILVVKDKRKFVLLDWRQDFGGLTKVGDIYYDLAKFYKGIILSDELIKEGMFSFKKNGKKISYDYFSKNKLLESKEEFEKFTKDNGFDLNKIKTITAIALLNMSPLHKKPFNFLVYYLGKSLLYKTLNERFEKGVENDI